MLFKQPKALYLLFFTEMWERFGYMALQSIFVLYLSHALHFSDGHAYLLIGAFGAFQWLSPVPGGYLADRFIGFQRAIIIGACLLALGYLAQAKTGELWFYIGLAILILGNGLFKPNVSSIVGTLYEKGDARRDSGFTIFYMGINLGTLLPPFFIGQLVMKHGWSWGFLIAAVGMGMSLLIFLLGKNSLRKRGAIPQHSLIHNSNERQRFNVLFVVGLIAAGIVFYLLLKIPNYSTIIFVVTSVLILVFIIRSILHLDSADRNNMLVCIVLTIISIGFWAIYMQCFSSFMLFADRNLDLHFLGMRVTPEFTQMYNSAFIIILSPLLSVVWPWLSKKKMNPSYPAKFMLGTLFMALGLLQLAFCVKFLSHQGYTNMWWLVLSYFLQTVGELVLSPIGLAMITALCPKQYVGMMMGVWFLAIAASNAFGGLLATLADVPHHATIFQSQAIYSHAFFDYGWIGIGLTLVAAYSIKPLKKLITH